MIPGSQSRLLRCHGRYKAPTITEIGLSGNENFILLLSCCFDDLMYRECFTSGVCNGRLRIMLDEESWPHSCKLFQIQAFRRYCKC